MSPTKGPPQPFPGPPEEPFQLLVRPPPEGTLVGLPAPAAPVPLPLPPARAAVASSARPLRKRLVLAREGGLEQSIEGLRAELVYSREWFASHGPAPRRRRPVLPLLLGIALGLGLGLGAAWSWPAVARIAPLRAPPAPGAQR
jgi:hypothetical protein